MIDLKIVEDLKNKLNSVKLYGCDNVKCGDVLYYPLILRKSLIITWLEYLKLLFRIIIALLYTSYNITSIGKPNSIFLISRTTKRKDLALNFFKAISFLQNRLDCIHSNKKRIICFSSFSYIPYLILWEKSLKKVIPDFKLRLFIIKSLFEIFIDYNYIMNQIKRLNIKVTNLITLCDVHATDSFFVQKFNSENIRTITLQHGTYSSQINNWVFRGSHSKVCFYIGQFTVDEAQKVINIDDKTIMKVGPMSYINYITYNKPNVLYNKKIGLILDGEIIRKDNIAMLTFIEKFCKKHKLQVIAKFHPTSNVQTYKEYLDSNTFREVYSNDISLLDFFKKVDVVIVGISTVFMESLLSWKPTFIYYNKNQIFNYYKNVTNKVKFETEEQLEKLLEHIKTPEFIGELEYLRNYMCASGDIKENYKKAFNQLGIY